MKKRPFCLWVLFMLYYMSVHKVQLLLGPLSHDLRAVLGTWEWCSPGTHWATPCHWQSAQNMTSSMFRPHLSSPASEPSPPPPSASLDTCSSTHRSRHSFGPKSEKIHTNQICTFSEEYVTRVVHGCHCAVAKVSRVVVRPLCGC